MRDHDNVRDIRNRTTTPSHEREIERCHEAFTATYNHLVATGATTTFRLNGLARFICIGARQQPDPEGALAEFTDLIQYLWKNMIVEEVPK